MIILSLSFLHHQSLSGCTCIMNMLSLCLMLQGHDQHVLNDWCIFRKGKRCSLFFLLLVLQKISFLLHSLSLVLPEDSIVVRHCTKCFQVQYSYCNKGHKNKNLSVFEWACKVLIHRIPKSCYIKFFGSILISKPNSQSCNPNSKMLELCIAGCYIDVSFLPSAAKVIT